MTTEKPLAGQCILITRARDQVAALVERIQAYGGDVFAFPVITIADPESWEPLDQAIRRIREYRWLVITSPNGARKFVSRMKAAGADSGILDHLRVVAVGPATAKVLTHNGIQVADMPTEFRGAALPDAMRPNLKPGDRVLMARGNLADPAPAERLRALGAIVDEVVAYRTLSEGGDVEALKRALQAHEIQYVTFTSGSTVRNLIQRLGGPEWLDGVRVAVIGPETKKAADEAGLPVHVMAREYTIDGLVEAVAEDCRQQKR